MLKIHALIFYTLCASVANKKRVFYNNTNPTWTCVCHMHIGHLLKKSTSIVIFFYFIFYLNYGDARWEDLLKVGKNWSLEIELLQLINKRCACFDTSLICLEIILKVISINLGFRKIFSNSSLVLTKPSRSASDGL